jgi:IclR family transcriptional regulator, acetate operon repressor
MSNDASGSDPRGTLLTLDRGIQVLEEVARQGGEATARGLSSALSINVGTCYQILRTLVAKGYVTRLPGSRYGLDTRVAFLMDHYESATAPPPELIEVLRDLHGKVGESVYVSLRRGTKIEISAYMEGTKALRVGALHVGYSDHPHARASGKAFLAFTDARQLKTFLREEDLVRITPSTITDWDEFLTELERIRERGYAIDLEEFHEGVACISAVLIGQDGVAQGAFGISMPATVLAAVESEVATAALDAGRRGSEILGYAGAYPPSLPWPKSA